MKLYSTHPVYPAPQLDKQPYIPCEIANTAIRQSIREILSRAEFIFSLIFLRTHPHLLATYKHLHTQLIRRKIDTHPRRGVHVAMRRVWQLGGRQPPATTGTAATASACSARLGRRLCCFPSFHGCSYGCCCTILALAPPGKKRLGRNKA